MVAVVLDTLQRPEVQLATFGRELDSHRDAIVGFDLDYVTITDPHVVATSGSDHHPILRPSERADGYEVDDYRRISVPLRSGATAWVYVFNG